jgi:hypothetical protein
MNHVDTQKGCTEAMDAATGVIIEISIGKFYKDEVVKLQDGYGSKLLRDPNSLCDSL